MKKNNLFIVAILITSLFGCGTTSQKPGNEEIRAYDIDFNWGEGGPNGFAKPDRKSTRLNSSH